MTIIVDEDTWIKLCKIANANTNNLDELLEIAGMTKERFLRFLDEMDLTLEDVLNE